VQRVHNQGESDENEEDSPSEPGRLETADGEFRGCTLVDKHQDLPQSVGLEAA